MSVIRGPHDGYTLMVGNTSGLATNVSLHKSLPYDPTKDFTPVALIARIPEAVDRIYHSVTGRRERLCTQVAHRSAPPARHAW